MSEDCAYQPGFEASAPIPDHSYVSAHIETQSRPATGPSRPTPL